MNRLSCARFLIKWISRVELLLVFFMFAPILGVYLYLLFPINFIGGQVYFFAYYGVGLVEPVAYGILAIYAAALLSDLYFSRKRPAGKDLPVAIKNPFQNALDRLHAAGSPKFSSSRVKVAAGDLSMGAHIRGIMSPRLVISGGLLVAFLRQDKRADAIIAHELSHISHLDRFFHAFLLIWSVNFVYTAFALAERMLSGERFEHIFLNLFIQFVACSLISERREVAADIAAATVVGKDVYLSVLTPSNGAHNKSGGSYFHPPLAHRRKQVLKYGRITSPSIGIVAWMLITAFLATARDQEGITVGMLSTAVFGILLEISRLSIRFCLSGETETATRLAEKQ